jgi:hypothetical protein
MPDLIRHPGLYGLKKEWIPDQVRNDGAEAGQHSVAAAVGPLIIHDYFAIDHLK